MTSFYRLLAVALLGLAPQAVSAAPTAFSADAVRFFEAKVRPILVEHCQKCHGKEKQRGGLRLDSREGALAGGDLGPAVVPGQPAKSIFIKAIGHGDDLKMPPSKKLPASLIADLTRWVEIGAPWSGAVDAPIAIRKGEMRITDKDRAHWAFQPVRRAAIPAVADPAWPLNPIDAFVVARLEAKGLRPNPPAAPAELIRRVTYDLTGLPPTLEDVDAFVANPSPAAYETLVDRLLASPRYGEKWGRHWLDLVRFAETNSFERDGPKPHAWRYRDYAIRAFNDDKPYDQFLREQLAGDELPQPDADALIATGFYRLGIWDDEPADRELARYEELDDIVATTGQVFLGLTFDCARCHDHKIDPIPQKDYYRLLSFFHNITPYHNGGPTDETALPGLPADAKALSVRENGPRAPDTFVLLRGNPQLKGDKVEPAFAVVLGGAPAEIAPPQPGARTSGRRLALANWIASADNPLTARVMVNRIWQHHFGHGIVRSTSNYGTQGDRPTHPELLDYLAAEFVARGWSLKALHRLMMTSRTYRMSARANTAALQADPANDLLGRFDMRRLTAEEVRDTILAITGQLNPRMCGPSIYPEIPKEVLAGQSMPGAGWGKSSPAEQNRRSVYIHVKRSLITPLLERFDIAEPDRSSPVRFATVQPTQALTMLNSGFLNQQATLLADRLQREVGPDLSGQVAHALRLATTRPIRPDEVRRGLDLIEGLEKEGLTAKKAMQGFCLLVLNLNEVVFLD